MGNLHIQIIAVNLYTVREYLLKIEKADFRILGYCGKQLQMIPNVYTLCVILSLWMWAGAGDLLLTNRIQQKRDGLSLLRLGYKRSWFPFCLYCFAFSHSWRWSQLPYGEARMAKNWRRPLANSSLATKPSVHPPIRNGILSPLSLEMNAVPDDT